MKKSCLIILLLWCFLPKLHSQNWNILNSGDRLLFYAGSDGFGSSSVYISGDSMIVSGNDTTFILNRKVDDNSSSFLHGNIPQVYQRELIHAANGDWIFHDTAQWVMRPADPVGSNWLFNSQNGISATISGNNQQTVLGQPDSVKTILLSNGDSILASRDHGLIYLPMCMGVTNEYFLAGKNQSADDSIPSFQTIFDFHPGDIFQYSIGYGDWINSTHIYEQDSIINVTFSPGVVIIQVKKKWKRFDTYSQDTTYGTGINSLTYSSTSYPEINYDKNNSVGNTYLLKFGYDTIFESKTKYFHPIISTGTNFDTLLISENYSPTYPDHKLYFANGLGITYQYERYSQFAYFSHYYYDSRSLDGVMINGNTLGNFKPESFYTEPPPVITRPDGLQTLVENDLLVKASYPTQNATVTIFDAAGNKVVEERFTGTTHINMESYANGIYFVRIATAYDVLNEYQIAHYTPKR